MFAEFDLVIPADLDEALRMLAQNKQREKGNDGIVPLAGGTNLLVDLRARSVTPTCLVGLGRLDKLRGIAVDNGRVTIGAGTTLSDILLDPRMARHAASLMDCARVFGGQMVRNTATVAGNVCYGSPAADTVPPLLALDAEVILVSRSGRRVVPLHEFFLGYKHDARRPDELLAEIAWPAPPAESVNCFYKLARRKGDAITVVGVAVSVTIKAGECTAARIALGAVAPVVKRALAAEEMLVGHALTPTLIDAAARQAIAACEPIDDVRASAEYRLHAVHVLTRRLLTQAWNELS